MYLNNKCVRFDLASVPQVLITGWQDAHDGVDLTAIHKQCRKEAYTNTIVALIVSCVGAFVWQFTHPTGTIKSTLFTGWIIAIIYLVCVSLYPVCSASKGHMHKFIEDYHHLMSLLWKWGYREPFPTGDYVAMSNVNQIGTFVRQHMAELSSKTATSRFVRHEYAQAENILRSFSLNPHIHSGMMGSDSQFGLRGVVDTDDASERYV